MYRIFGFQPAGVRKNYYTETNEDALVMWAHDVADGEYAGVSGVATLRPRPRRGEDPRQAQWPGE
jgi:ribosomal-protein-alanine N-acetyltransferase